MLKQVLAEHPNTHVALIGYSFGAGVLPFVYNRLSKVSKARVVMISRCRLVQ